jgi:hypothetical protein
VRRKRDLVEMSVGWGSMLVDVGMSTAKSCGVRICVVDNVDCRTR